MMNTKKTQIIGSCMLLLSICLQCFSQPKSIQKVLPQYQKNPNVSLGGYSVTLANGDDTTGIFKPTNCSLALPAIGIVKVTANTADNFIDIPLATMAASAGYNFETNVYKIFKLRIQADKKIEGNLVVEYTTIFEGKSETFAASVAHKKGDWVEHALDFSKVPQWRGSLTNIKLKMLEGAENIGLSVLIDKIELVTDDESDKTFGLNSLLLNVIQRVKIDTRNFRSEIEDIANFKGETLPKNSQNLDGRIYYFAKDNGTDRTAINRYFNKATGDYLDAIKQPSNGYILDAELGFVWTKYYPGMSPVLRAINKKTGWHTLVVATEKKEGYIVDDTLGFAYARNEKPLQEYEFESDAMDDIFYINSGKVRFGVNLSHGAAGWHWYYGNKQMENINDFGRQVQLSYYTNKLNPSEVGFGRGQVGNPVAFVYKIGNTLITRTVPIDWNFKNVLRDEGSISHPDIIPGIILGKDVTFGILGHAELAKWTAYVHTPVAIDKYNGGSQLEIFSNHPTADMWYRANVDFDNNGKLFISATKTNLEKQPDEEKGAFYNYPKSGFGGNISALGAEDNQLAFGLMVGTYSDEKNKILSNAYYTFAGENRTHSSRHVNISAAGKLGPEHASPFDNYTTAQRSVMRTPTVAGDNRYIVYAMTGTMADVKAWMQDLYNNREKLEW